MPRASQSFDEGDHGVEVSHTEIASQKPAGFILRTFGNQPLVLAFADYAKLQAMDRAVIARHVPLPEFPVRFLGADLYNVRIPGCLVILRDEGPGEKIILLHETGRPPPS